MDSLAKLLFKVDPESCLVITPRFIAAREIQKSLLDRTDTLFGLKFLTSHQLILNLHQRRTNAPRIVSQTICQEIISNIAQRLFKKDKDRLFQLIAKPNGKKAACHTIQELIKCGYGPEDLMSIDDHYTRKIGELFGAYLQFFQENNVEDIALAEAHTVDEYEAGKIELAEIEHLWLSEFVQISFQQNRLFRAFSRKKNVYCNFPLDKLRPDLFSSIQKFMTATQAKDRCFSPVSATSQLAEMQNQIFTEKQREHSQVNQNVTFYSAPGRFDEIEAVGTQIASLINSGVSPENIALSTRSLSDYDQFIRNVFDKFAIPYSYRRGLPIMNSPLVRVALKCAEIARESTTYDSLLAVIRSRFMPLRDSLKWQSIIINADVYEARPEKWIHVLGTIAEKEGLNFEQIKSFLNDCVNLHRNKPDSLSSFLKFINSYMLPTLSALPNQAKEEFTNHFQQFELVIENVVEELNTFAELGISLSGNPFDLLRDRLKNESIRENQHPGETVSVLSIFDTGYRKFDHLFIVGMDENSIPQSTISSNNLLNDTKLMRLNNIFAKSRGKLRTIDERRRSEEQAFFLALCSAQSQVQLYYPSVDGEGRELIPSPYYTELQAIAAGEIVQLPGGDVRQFKDVQPDKHSVRRQLVRQLFRRDLAEFDPDALPAFHLLKQNQQEEQFIESLSEIINIEESRLQSTLQEDSFNRWTGIIEDTAVKSRIAQRFQASSWSASRIQAYADSPFLFFIRSVLCLKELRLPGEDEDPRKVGTLYHDILKNFVMDYCQFYPVTNFDHAWEIMKKHVANAFPHSHNEENIASLINVSRYRTETIMKRFIRQEMSDPSSIPAVDSLEMAFNGDQVSFNYQGREIRLHGRFDRIDNSLEDEQFRTIVDYKKGESKAPSVSALNNRQKIQLPFYILAASILLGIPVEKLQGKYISLEKSSTSLFSLKKNYCDYFSTEKLNPGSEKQLQENIYDMISSVVTSVEDGDFRVSGDLKHESRIVARWLELPPEFLD